MMTEMPAATSVARPDAFRPPGQRLHHRAAAHRHAGLRQRVQKIEQQRVKDLLGEGLLAGQPERVRQFFGDAHAQGVRLRAPRAVPLVGYADGRLHHAPRAPVHVKLAPRKPAQIGGIRGIEQQQGGLPAGSAQVERQRALGVFQLSLETRLVGDIRNQFRLQLQKNEFMLSRLQHLHLTLILYPFIRAPARHPLPRVLQYNLAQPGTRKRIPAQGEKICFVFLSVRFLRRWYSLCCPPPSLRRPPEPCRARSRTSREAPSPARPSPSRTRPPTNTGNSIRIRPAVTWFLS